METWNYKIRSGKFLPDPFLVFIKGTSKKVSSRSEKIVEKKENILFGILELQQMQVQIKKRKKV